MNSLISRLLSSICTEVNKGFGSIACHNGFLLRQNGQVWSRAALVCAEREDKNMGWALAATFVNGPKRALPNLRQSYAVQTNIRS